MNVQGDNSSLWESDTFNYPQFYTPSVAAAYQDSSNSQNTPFTHDQFTGVRDNDNYIELMSNNNPQQHGGPLPTSFQYPPFHNGQNYFLPETNSYLPPTTAIPNQHMSPDGGYSSPSNVGSEYFETPYHGQTQEYLSGMSPYSNMFSSLEPGTIDQPIKQESQDSQPPVYTQMEYVAQSANDSKPIIHENIMISPPLKLDGQAQPAPQSTVVQEQPRFQVSNQVTKEFIHDEVGRIIYRAQYVVPIDDQQPSTFRAPISSTPAASLTSQQPVVTVNVDSAADSDVIEKPQGAIIDPQDRRSARPSVIKQNNFVCDQCGSFFARQCGLTQHKKWIHSPRLISCAKCGKKFLTQEDLEKHIVNHIQINKPYKCPVCPKQFCHKNDLRRHMFRHEDNVPFACDICHRGFIRADHLKAHLISHERRRKINAKKPVDRTNLL